MRKKQRGRGFEQPVTSELTTAQCPRASPSPQREHSPVLFTQHDQPPSAAASDMILFGVSDNELDDSLSLAASDAEELSGSVTDPALLRHLKMKEADKVPFLDAPVWSGSLFGPAVEGFAGLFTEAQKSSQAMGHFLPKRTSSSTASSRRRPAPTQQIAKPPPATPEPDLLRVGEMEGAHARHDATPSRSAKDPGPKSRSSRAHYSAQVSDRLRGRDRPSAQSFPENAGSYGSGFAGTSVESAFEVESAN